MPKKAFTSKNKLIKYDKGKSTVKMIPNKRKMSLSPVKPPAPSNSSTSHHDEYDLPFDFEQPEHLYEQQGNILDILRKFVKWNNRLCYGR
jgi:hypothetical protein